jgi:glutathione S-transferase
MTITAIPRLQYFAFRGRALAARVSLFNSLGKDGWVDERVSLPRFKKAQPFPLPASPADRTKAEYVTNNLPQIVLPGGLKVTQSHAIARYATKLAYAPSPDTHTATQEGDKRPSHYVCLYPDDPVSGLLVDEAVAVIDQILLLTPKDEDPATRAKNREAFHCTGFLRVGMELLEGRLSDSGGPFLLGSELSLADLYIRAPLADLFDLQQFEGVPPAFYDEFPRLQACAAAVSEHPLLKAYHQHYKS